MQARLIALLVFASSAAGCAADCTCLEIATGFVVTVQDAVTGNTICNATVTLTDPDGGVEVLTHGSDADCNFESSIRPEGTYALNISAPGYASLSTTVTQPSCSTYHFDTYLLTPN